MYGEDDILVENYRVREYDGFFYPERSFGFWILKIWIPLYSEGHEGGSSPVFRYNLEEAWDLIAKEIEKRYREEPAEKFYYTSGEEIQERIKRIKQPKIGGGLQE